MEKMKESLLEKKKVKSVFFHQFVAAGMNHLNLDEF